MPKSVKYFVKFGLPGNQTVTIEDEMISGVLSGLYFVREEIDLAIKKIQQEIIEEARYE